MTSIRSVLAWAFVGLAVVGVAPSCAEEAADEVGAILSRHVGVYTTPPDTVGALDPNIKAYRIPDGPLMGNGDLAVAVGGTDRAQTFYLSKSDLSHSMRGLGGLTYTFDATPADPGAYRQEQDLYRSEVRSVLPFEKSTVRMRSFTADVGNVLVTELWTEGNAATEVTLKIWSHPNGSNTQAFTGNGIIGCTREINTTMGTTRQPFHSAVAVASRVLGARTVCETDRQNSSTARFTLDPGARVRVVTVAAGGYRATDPVSQAKAQADGLDDRAIDALQADHPAWWKGYWSRSYVILNDDLLEKFYYGALYVLACSSRDGSTPPASPAPGIWTGRSAGQTNSRWITTSSRSTGASIPATGRTWPCRTTT